MSLQSILAMPEPLTLAMAGATGTGIMLIIAKRQFGVFKNALDYVGAFIAGIIALPVLILAAIMIKIADPKGPVIYTQIRVGLNGNLFTIYKLRSMYVDAEAKTGAMRAQSSDDRVIPICRWMRKSHVDELPQIYNILRGEMSLVGPRPERPELFKELTKIMPDFEKRLAVKPGLTGLAQIKNGYDVDDDSVKRKLAYDLHYIENMGVRMEFKLLLSTFAMFNDKGAR